jgi:LSD1 subclass zinc finger protein
MSDCVDCGSCRTIPRCTLPDGASDVDLCPRCARRRSSAAEEVFY